MSFYLFRLQTAANTFEADCNCLDDNDARSAAQTLAADFETVEVWSGNRHVVSMQKDCGPVFPMQDA